MRAIIVGSHGGPEVLRLAELPAPEPGPADVLVATGAAGVNYIDVHYRSGRYVTRLPFVPGQEGAGTVVRAGSAVTSVAVGQRVAWVNVPGGYAELVAVPADRTVPLPEGLPTDTAAAVLLQGMTAHFLAYDCCPLVGGETVLVHAAAGGVGQLLTQLAKDRGLRVIATVSTARKEAVARAAGADEVIRYRDTPLLPALRRLVCGSGLAAVFDGVGAPTFDAGLASLSRRATFVLYGQAGGRVRPVDLERLNAGGSLFVTRPKLDDYTATRKELLARAGAVFELVAAGKLRTRIAGRWPLAEAPDAHAELESRRSDGKLLLMTRGEPTKEDHHDA